MTPNPRSMKTSRSRELLVAFLQFIDTEQRSGNRNINIDTFLSTLKDTEESLPVPSQGEAIGFGDFLKHYYRVVDNPDDTANEATLWMDKGGDTFTTAELYDLFTTQSTAK